MKNRIRLTESQLHRVIKESVRKVLNEGNMTIESKMWEQRCNEAKHLLADILQMVENSKKRTNEYQGMELGGQRMSWCDSLRGAIWSLMEIQNVLNDKPIDKDDDPYFNRKTVNDITF